MQERGKITHRSKRAVRSYKQLVEIPSERTRKSRSCKKTKMIIPQCLRTKGRTTKLTPGKLDALSFRKSTLHSRKTTAVTHWGPTSGPNSAVTPAYSGWASGPSTVVWTERRVGIMQDGRTPSIMEGGGKEARGNVRGIALDVAVRRVP